MPGEVTLKGSGCAVFAAVAFALGMALLLGYVVGYSRGRLDTLHEWTAHVKSSG